MIFATDPDLHSLLTESFEHYDNDSNPTSVIGAASIPDVDDFSSQDEYDK